MPRCLGFRILEGRLGKLYDAAETSVEMREFRAVEMYFWPPDTGLITESDHIVSVAWVSLMTSSCKVPNAWFRYQIGHGHVIDWATCAALRGVLATCFLKIYCCALRALSRPDVMAVLCG
jgi:hypothetical protein